MTGRHHYLGDLELWPLSHCMDQMGSHFSFLLYDSIVSASGNAETLLLMASQQRNLPLVLWKNYTMEYKPIMIFSITILPISYNAMLIYLRQNIATTTTNLMWPPTMRVMVRTGSEECTTSPRSSPSVHCHPSPLNALYKTTKLLSQCHWFHWCSI